LPRVDAPPASVPYRRQIRLETESEGVILGALEDTAHHVRVTLRFSDGCVTSVSGEPVRLPWSTCPGAASGLATLVGTRLTTSLRHNRHLFEPVEHCTHFFDLAQLTLSHAASGRSKRLYDILCWEDGPTKTAQLHRDGELILDWSIEGGTINQPSKFAGVGMREGFVRWCSENLDDDTAEAAFALRRAASMSVISSLVMDDYPVVTASGLTSGVCYTAQPQRIDLANRHYGSQRDYSAGFDGMLDGFDEALRSRASQ
jgi:hypothetical protein